MYSNLLPDCVYDHPTLCQEWGWGAFLGLVVSLKQGSCLPMSQKSQDHRWYQLCLSLSCALLRRLFEHVCPMHPIMPWRYLQFDLAHTTTSVLRDSATTFTSSVSVRSTAFLLPSTGFLVPAQFNFRRSHVCCPKDNSYTLL